MKSVKNIYKAIGWAIVVLILSSISGNQLNKLPKIKIPHLDKVIHFGMYFIFALLLISGLFQLKKKYSTKYSAIFTFLISIAYGGMIEVLQQSFFKERSMDIYDFVSNCVGALCGVLLYPIIRKSKYLF